MQSVDSTLIVFARAPILGQVKTRLARSLGDAMTLKVYEYLLANALEMAVASQFDRVCCYTDKPDHIFFNHWLPQNRQHQQGRTVIMATQSGDDLGERMLTAIRQQLLSSESVALMGSDCLQLDTAILNQVALELRQQHVIIPANDGGYVLIGFKKEAEHSVFESINWGSDQVFSDTLQKFKSAALACKQFPSLQDIDTIEDYKCLKKSDQMIIGL